MEHYWKKAILIPAVAAKQVRGKFDASISWEVSQGGTTPKLNGIGNNFYMI